MTLLLEIVDYCLAQCITRFLLSPPNPPTPKLFFVSYERHDKNTTFTPVLGHWFCPHLNMSPILFSSLCYMFSFHSIYYLCLSVRLTYLSFVFGVIRIRPINPTIYRVNIKFWPLIQKGLKPYWHCFIRVFRVRQSKPLVKVKDNFL